MARRWYTRAARRTRSPRFVRYAPALSLVALILEWRRQRRRLRAWERAS